MTAAAWARFSPASFVLASRQAFAHAAQESRARPRIAATMQPPSTEAPAIPAPPERQLAAWLSAAAGGDTRAFEQFYEATARQAMALVRRVAGQAYAEDVLADCYFQAWRNAAQFDPGRGSALAWLLTMARSRALDRLRQEQLRHGGLTGAPEFDADSEPAAHELGPDSLLESTQASSRVHAALAQPSANERWVLGLAFFRDCTQTEIAALTGMPLGTVKSLITRAQHKMRESLTP
jgi:RNA polymerase sigma-70 factor, ECF subfamily